MWLECHQRSAWKYQHVECNYTLLLWGSATFKRRISPVLSPHQAVPHKELRGFTGVTCSARQAGSKAEQWQVTRTSSFRPPGLGGFPRCLQKGQPILQQLKSSDLGEEVAKNSIPALLKQVTHLLLFIRLLVLRERLLFLKNKNTPLQPKKKCFHLLILNFHLKQILSFKTKCFF